MTARILIVDDVLVNLRLLESLLVGAGFDVVTAASAKQCLIEIENAAPDIILLDVMMPEIDGIEVCRRIKGDPKTKNIPVIMVSASSQSSDRADSLAAGAEGFFTKPINDVALLECVRSLVGPKT